MPADLHRPMDDDPPGDGGTEALPIWVARLQERLLGIDRLYRHKFEALVGQLSALERKVETQQKWIQGTAILVGLEVLGIIVALLNGWKP